MFLDNMKRGSVLDVGLVCCFIPTIYRGVEERLLARILVWSTQVRILPPLPVEYIK